MINSIKYLLVGILTSILSLVVCTNTYAQSTYLQHFTTKDGLPSNNCFYILQDSKGYIWVSSDAGVSRFDGKVFENFSVNDGLPDNQILQVKEDKSGRIWFLSFNGQLSYFFNGKIYNNENNKLLKLLKFNAVIVSFFQDTQGRIWLGTNKNLLVMWDGKRIRNFISANMNRQFINTFVHEDATGKIWAISNHGFKTFDGSNFNSVPHTSLPLSFRTSLNMPDHRLAYLDQKGLNIKNGAKQYLAFSIDTLLLNNEIGFFHLDAQNGLWLSNGSGIHHIEKNGKTNNYLKDIAASQVIEDTKHNMWFTTENGIYMLPQKDERLYMISKADGISNDAVKSIVKDNSNRFWLGFDNGNINSIDMADLKVSKLAIPDKKYKLIKQLSFDKQNNVIYFASDFGLGKIKGLHQQNKQLDYLKNANNSIFVIKSFSIAKDNGLALALSSGVVILRDRINDFKFRSFYFKKSADFFNDRAYSVFYDQENNLWFSNINGLAKLTEGKLYNYYEKSPLLTRRINDIQQLNDGTVVLATDGYGLLYIKDKKVVKVITQLNGLADNICKKLFVKDNSVWVITNNGINKVSLNGQNASIETFEYTNALLANNVNGMYIDSDYAYFATNNGLVYFSANKAATSTTPPNVYISAVTNNKVRLDLSPTQQVLNPSNNTIAFTYSAIDFQNKNITYRYRLKSDGNWTETKNRRLEFSSLEPGDYTFELSAKSNNSTWSSPARVSFILKAHFWQTIWFLAIILVLAGFTFYKIAVVVTKRQKNKEQEQLLLKNKILMLEQRALQAMMNPHFVFNVMNSIQHYINTKDTSSANKVLTGFARLIRKNLEICTKSFISLDEELEYLELYLSLEKKRFGEKFNYTITVNKSIDREETMLPSMILQPYIENAIWHGIMPKEDGGTITINIDLDRMDKLIIEIIDDGIGIDNSLRDKTGHHISKGMSLTKERINLLNQTEVNPIQMEIKQNGNSGTFVRLSIPINE